MQVFVKLSIINLIVLFLLQRIFNSHSPLLARRHHGNVLWLAGIGLQSLFGAGNAFSESLWGWEYECLFMGRFEGKEVPHWKKEQAEQRLACRQVEENPFLGPQKVIWEDLAELLLKAGWGVAARTGARCTPLSNSRSPFLARRRLEMSLVCILKLRKIIT